MANETNQADSSLGAKFYKVKDICELFGINPITLYRWRKANKFPQPVRFGARLLWPVDTVNKAIAKANAAVNPELCGAGALSAN
jgi:predicted DNA-binding transcriptional regulator AlpA